MEALDIRVFLKDCEACKGSGKTKQHEYTPPFESFMGQCPRCRGEGKLVERTEHIKTTQQPKDTE